MKGDVKLVLYTSGFTIVESEQRNLKRYFSLLKRVEFYDKNIDKVDGLTKKMTNTMVLLKNDLNYVKSLEKMDALHTYEGDSIELIEGIDAEIKGLEELVDLKGELQEEFNGL
jgi:hypothetical protein